MSGALTRRELNRALLARQMLLGRESVSALGAIERLVALQAQVVSPPHVGLWSRVEGYVREDLLSLFSGREVVRATLLRSTLHLVSSRDYLAFRATLRPVLLRALGGFFGRRVGGFDPEEVVSVVEEKLAGESLSRGEISGFLAERYPEADAQAMAYAASSYLPLVQVPGGGSWGYSAKPPYALAADWIGEPESPDSGTRALIPRYLAAFGPAGVMDFQAWSGLTKTKPAFDDLRPDLLAFEDENGRELFDLPNAPRPEEDTPARACFVPEYDNLVLSHADRSRIIADEHKKRVFLSAARVRATILVDGFVAGTWKVEKARGEATLTVEPFGKLPREAKASLADEGESLIRFLREDAKSHHVRFERA